MKNETLTDEQYETIIDLAAEYDGDVISYSGRGMCDDECLAVTIRTDGMAFVMTLGAQLADYGDLGLAESMAAKVCTDDMGRGIVIYFPGIAAPDMGE